MMLPLCCCICFFAIREGALSKLLEETGLLFFSDLVEETGLLCFSVLFLREGFSEDCCYVYLLASENCCSVYLVACLVTLLMEDRSVLVVSGWLGVSSMLALVADLVALMFCTVFLVEWGVVCMATLPVVSFVKVSCFSSTLGTGGSFSSPYLAARCLTFLAAFLALLVSSLVTGMSALMAHSARPVRLGSSSKLLQTWLLVQRDSLTASFLLLHMVSVLRAASSCLEDLRAASSEVLRAVSAAEDWRTSYAVEDC